MIFPNFVVFSTSMSQQDFGEQDWEIEKIIGSKLLPAKVGKYKYLVKEMGWSNEYNQ